MSFLERAKQVAEQAAKVGAEVGREAAKVGAEVGQKAATTIRDPATKARAQSAVNKAKRGFTTALERIDPRILADVVVKATSLQERANASLKERGSLYRISEIGIGAAPANRPVRRKPSTSSIDAVRRSPDSRRVTSTPPAASERGETVRVQGIPSSSASVNFTPGDSSRSSYRISRPAAFASSCSRSAVARTFSSRPAPIDTRCAA